MEGRDGGGDGPLGRPRNAAQRRRFGTSRAFNQLFLLSRSDTGNKPDTQCLVG